MDLEKKIVELERRVAELEKDRMISVEADRRVLIPLIHREAVLAMQGHKALRG